MPSDDPPFWKTIPLDRMTQAQWESLCDGCAQCCLQKIEDEDTREIYYTNIACDLLDAENCRCTHYTERSQRVPTCVTLTPEHLKDPYWLPPTCAYRLLAEGKPLPAWHPLVSGDPDSVELSGHSVRGRTVPESEADDWEFHLIDWI
ncbi:MAG: YcgN family cysteine cluster protein [Candidatus Thiodiazotropha sp.]